MTNEPASVEDSRLTSGVYGRTFWLAYLANSCLVTANALTVRFAELVHFLGGTESTVGDIVALGTMVAVALRFSVSHYLDDYGTRRVWPVCSILFIVGCAIFIIASARAQEMFWLLYLARVAF